jgi:hypothetical protein
LAHRQTGDEVQNHLFEEQHRTALTALLSHRAADACSCFVPPGGFYAIVTKVETVYEVILPPKVEAILALISFTIDLGMGSFTSVMTCVDLRGFETRLVFWMLLPPVLIGVILFGTTVRLCYEQRLSREAFAQVSAHPMLVVTFIFYPLIANVAFEAFSCHESLDGHRYLMADVAIDCGSDYYKQVNRLAWLAVFIYVFGVFGVVCLLLFCARKAITRQTPTLLSSSLAFLYREYEPWAFWWGSALNGIQPSPRCSLRARFP